MRWSVVLVVLIFAACRKGVQSLDVQLLDARSLLNNEHYELALGKAETGLARAEREGNEKDRWNFRLLKADVLIGQRLAAKLLPLLDQYGEPPPGSAWTEVRSHLLLVRGRASYVLNRLPESADLLAQAATAAHEAGSTSLVAEVRLRQGALLARQSRFESARLAFREVIETARSIHDPYLEANGVGNMGFVLLNESRTDEAIPWFEEAIALFTPLGAEESVHRTQGNLANCYWRLGDYDRARALYENAQLGFARTGNLDGQQIWIGNAGNVALETGHYAEAKQAYQRALEIARRIPSPVWVARWLTNLAAISVALSDWDAAESYNVEALQKLRDLRDFSWEPTALMNAARIEEGRGHVERAKELFQSALSKRAEDPSVPLDSHAGLARSFAHEGRMAEAEDEFRNTLGMLETLRSNLVKEEYKLPYQSSLIRFYREYVDFLVSRGQPERALEVAESSRSRVLEAKSGRTETSHHSAVDYRRLASQMRAVLLEYWLGPGQSYLWVITPEKIRLHTLPPLRDIRPLIERYRSVIAAGRNPLEAARDTGHRLYEILLAPEPETSRTGRFVVVPDGDLYSLDLESLPTPGDTGKYWIETATLHTAPSLNYLVSRAGAARSHTNTGLLVMGDPTGSSAQFPRLEFAAREIDAVTSMVGGTGSTILRGEAARPASYNNAQPGQFSFIHFATHAIANPQRPLESAVILSGPADTNRLLARDVMAIPLSAELVTISACRSAGGKTYGGEGLVGFAWAFLRAGAHNVIAGLWDVSDRSTAELMASLYREIAAGKDVATALRTAKLGLIHKGGAWAKPFYWAPFQLYVGAPQ